MQTFLEILRVVVAVGIGLGVGYAFGLLQNAALRRNEEQEQSGTFKNVWSLMPGSGARVALLLITLVIVQLVCPMFFADGTQWWVSGGVVAAYGWMLFQRLRHRRATCT